MNEKPLIKGKIKEYNFITSWEYICINRECPICKEIIDTNLKEINISWCGHGVHESCKKEWDSNNNTTHCVICNSNRSRKY